MAELNFVEWIGLEVLRRRIGREESDIHKWSHLELAEIQRIERRTTVVAAFAGASSGAILGIVEIWLGEGALDVTGATPWRSLCGRPFRPQAVLDLRREFISGQGLSEKHLRRLAL